MVETDPVAVKMHDCTEEILIEWVTAKLTNLSRLS